MKTRYKIAIPIVIIVVVFVFFQTWMLIDCIFEGGEPRLLSCEWIFVNSIIPHMSAFDAQDTIVFADFEYHKYM